MVPSLGGDSVGQARLCWFNLFSWSWVDLVQCQWPRDMVTMRNIGSIHNQTAWHSALFCTLMSKGRYVCVCRLWELGGSWKNVKWWGTKLLQIPTSHSSMKALSYFWWYYWSMLNTSCCDGTPVWEYYLHPFWLWNHEREEVRERCGGRFEEVVLSPGPVWARHSSNVNVNVLVLWSITLGLNKLVNGSN